MTKHIRRHLHEFAMLAAELCSQPTYLPEVVPERPACIGASDAARHGMGGVLFDHEDVACWTVLTVMFG